MRLTYLNRYTGEMKVRYQLIKIFKADSLHKLRGKNVK